MKAKFWKRRTKKKEPQKSPAREWTNAIVFAVVVASLFRWATFEAYAIPTSSMEKSLLVGDYLFVSKLHYGPRTPQTPLQIPLTHQTIWGTNIPAYSNAIQLPSFRLPGFSEIKRNDAVVFNFPAEEEHPADQRTHYIKRCVGLAGDTIAIHDRQIYINGKAADNPEQMQFSYFIATNKVLHDKFFSDRAIIDVSHYPNEGYQVHTTPAKAKELSTLEFIREVRLLNLLPGEAEPEAFPQAPNIYTWNRDNFGPLYIPKAGATVPVTPATLPLYQKIIMEYEHPQNATVRDDKLYIEGKEVTHYTFGQNYYFMMGDNRHNSLDSRYWGLVPEDHIVGKAVLVWNSIDPNADLSNKIRWKRLFSLVK